MARKRSPVIGREAEHRVLGRRQRRHSADVRARWRRGYGRRWWRKSQ
jgi:hypothetical protein